MSKLKARVSAEQRRVMEAVREGRPRDAVKHSRRAEHHVAKLLRSEPGNQYHHLVLAGIHYNRAVLHEALGDAGEALASIRQAVHVYTELDPSHGDPSAVRDLVRGNPGERSAIEELIALSADARARLARMLATYEGASAAEAVHLHGRAAIAVYRALTTYGDKYDKADLRRIEGQYDEAKARLSGGPR